MPNQLQKIVLFLIFLASFSTFSQTPNFSGTWKLNFEKSNLDKNDSLNGLTSQVFVIQQTGDRFKLKIYHYYGDKKRKIGFKMKSDGKTRTVKLLFKGKLEPKENSLLATIWRNGYFNCVNYAFGKNQNELVADETYKGRPRDHHSIWVFDRVISK